MCFILFVFLYSLLLILCDVFPISFVLFISLFISIYICIHNDQSVHSNQLYPTFKFPQLNHYWFLPMICFVILFITNDSMGQWCPLSPLPLPTKSSFISIYDFMDWHGCLFVSDGFRSAVLWSVFFLKAFFFSPSHDWLMQLVLCALYRYYSHYHPSRFLFSVFTSLFPLSSLLLFFPQFLITSILSLLSPLSFLSPLLSLPSILYFLPLTSLLFSPLPSKLCTVSLLWRLVRILSYYCKIPFARYQIIIFMTHKLHIIRYPCILSLIPLLSSSVSFLIEYMSFILPFLSHPCTNNNNIYSFICQQQLEFGSFSCLVFVWAFEFCTIYLSVHKSLLRDACIYSYMNENTFHDL